MTSMRKFRAMSVAMLAAGLIVALLSAPADARGGTAIDVKGDFISFGGAPAG